MRVRSTVQTRVDAYGAKDSLVVGAYGTNMGESKPGRKPRVSNEEVVAVFEAAETPVLRTRDVAEELPIGHRAVLNRLNALRERGTLEKMEVDPRGRVWWLADADRARERDHFKSFGKYADTNIGETAEAVGERFDRDLRERREERSDADR